MFSIGFDVWVFRDGIARRCSVPEVLSGPEDTPPSTGTEHFAHFQLSEHLSLASLAARIITSYLM